MLNRVCLLEHRMVATESASMDVILGLKFLQLFPGVGKRKQNWSEVNLNCPGRILKEGTSWVVSSFLSVKSEPLFYYYIYVSALSFDGTDTF